MYLPVTVLRASATQMGPIILLTSCCCPPSIFDCSPSLGVFRASPWLTLKSGKFWHCDKWHFRGDEVIIEKFMTLLLSRHYPTTFDTSFSFNVWSSRVRRSATQSLRNRQIGKLIAEFASKRDRLLSNTPFFIPVNRHYCQHHRGIYESNRGHNATCTRDIAYFICPSDPMVILCDCLSCLRLAFIF